MGDISLARLNAGWTSPFVVTAGHSDQGKTIWRHQQKSDPV